MKHNTEVEEKSVSYLLRCIEELTSPLGELLPDGQRLTKIIKLARLLEAATHHQLQKAQNEAYTKGRSDEAKTCTGCQGRCEEQLQKARQDWLEALYDQADEIYGGTIPVAVQDFIKTLNQPNLDHPTLEDKN